MPALASIVRGLLKIAVVIAAATLGGVGLGIVLAKISGNEGGNAAAPFTDADSATPAPSVGTTGASGTAGSPATGSSAPEAPAFTVLSARLERGPAGSRQPNAARVRIMLLVQTGRQPLVARTRLLAGFTDRAMGPRGATAAGRLRVPADTTALRVLRFRTAGDRTTSLRRTRRATLRIGRTSLRVRLSGRA